MVGADGDENRDRHVHFSIRSSSDLLASLVASFVRRLYPGAHVRVALKDSADWQGIPVVCVTNKASGRSVLLALTCRGQDAVKLTNDASVLLTQDCDPAKLASAMEALSISDPATSMWTEAPSLQTSTDREKPRKDSSYILGAGVPEATGPPVPVGCTHRWLLDAQPDQGGITHAHCKLCGATRTFSDAPLERPRYSFADRS